MQMARDGYDIELTAMIAEAVRILVIASGGAGLPEHLHEVLTEGKGRRSAGSLHGALRRLQG